MKNHNEASDRTSDTYGIPEELRLMRVPLVQSLHQSVGAGPALHFYAPCLKSMTVVADAVE